MIPSERNNISPLVAIAIVIGIIVGVAWVLSKIGEVILTFTDK
jgi:hypothetical protein